jgi:hypothetical protein
MPFSLLLTALAEIRDPRRPQGRRYALAPLLLISELPVLAGATSYQGIITFIDVHRERLNTEFGVCFRRAPALNTLRNLLLALDPADLEAAFRRHARHLDQRIGAAGWRTVALDGKTLRGSFDHLHDQPAAHVLSAFASEAALILGLIAELGLTKVLFTADALHCQKKALNKLPRPATPCWCASSATSPAFTTRWPPCATRNARSTAMRAWTGTAMVARSTA